MIIIENSGNFATVIYDEELFEQQKENITSKFMFIDRVPLREFNGKDAHLMVDVEQNKIWYEYFEPSVVEENPLTLQQQLEQHQAIIDAMLGVSEE